MSCHRRPRIRIEFPRLGLLDPYALEVEEHPAASGQHRIRLPTSCKKDGDSAAVHIPVERAGLCLAGASEALFHLSLRWMQESGALGGMSGFPEDGQEFAGHLPHFREIAAGENPPDGRFPRSPVQIRLALDRREGRLLAALLRRHLRRLPQPTPWMMTLLSALEEMDDYLSWQEPSVG